MTNISIEQVKERAEIDAKRNGCYLYPDANFLESLLVGLKQKEERYNYPSCPCRLASGKIEFDRDVICPCDYRDPDVAEFGACYCALYVDKEVKQGIKKLDPVPERRSLEKQARAFSGTIKKEESNEQVPIEESKGEIEIKLKLWYCKQCGYIAFREDPPLVCPICRAKKELFTEIKTQVVYST